MTNTEQNEIDSDRQSSSTSASEYMAWLLVGGGVVGALVMVIRGYRRFIEWAIPAGLIGLGLAFLLRQRQKHVDEVVESTLADPGTPAYKRVKVIINPASGQDEAILNTLNDVFHRYEVEWDASITHQAGDATRLAQQAVAEGVDLVVGYGGDGTQMEIASGVLGSDTPMAILPGGTGNAMAFELQVPRHLRQAAELICRSSKRQAVDLAKIGERYFMLRTYTGPRQEDVASRAEKDRYGVLAYPAASLRVLKHLVVAQYKLTIDGQEINDEGLLCYLFNAGSMGGIDAPKPKEISVSDGLLDVLMVNDDRQSRRAIASYTLSIGKARANIHHWQGKEIVVEADPPQPVWLDGEPYGQTPFTATVLPQAVQVVVP
jgi:YegS/Rv2252/BmrU family lipid kinase